MAKVVSGKKFKLECDLTDAFIVFEKGADSLNEQTVAIGHLYAPSEGGGSVEYDGYTYVSEFCFDLEELAYVTDRLKSIAEYKKENND